jgi:DNA-binding FrmR family transcriptional regulator
MASQQTTKRLICVWKGCDDVFEEAAAFKEHIDKHIHELMQTDLDNQWKNGTEEQQEEDKPLAKVNEDKMANGMDIGRR